ncbi:MAG TPA: hypothetical protein VIK25_09790 [Gemmatimonadaceae bacterium]
MPAMPREEFRVYSTQLFDEWDESLGTDFALKEYSLRLEVEEGSVVGLAFIGATLGALYYGIASYPSFVEGLQKIQSHVRTAGDHLVLRAAEPFTRLNLKPRITRRSGVPGQLQRLLLRVKRREIDVEVAMREAERLLGAEAAASPDFMRALAGSLMQVRRNPEQLFLPMELPEEVDARAGRERPSRAKTPKESPPHLQHLKIEVWRDTRTGKRRVRITEL